MHKLSPLPIFSCIILITLMACTAKPPTPKPVVLKSQSTPQVYLAREALTTDIEYVLEDFYAYQSIAQYSKDDIAIRDAYLTRKRAPSVFLLEKRQEKLAALARQERADEFFAEYNNLPEKDRTNDLRCYHDALMVSYSKTISSLAAEKIATGEKLSAACKKLVLASIVSGNLNEQDLWRQIWTAIANNELSYARDIATRMGYTLQTGSAPDGTRIGNAGALANIITPHARNQTAANSKLSEYQATGLLKADEIEFAYGVLAMSHAKDLNMSQALRDYQRTTGRFLTEEQWSWYARAALRLRDWYSLNQAISAMPEKLQNNEAWLYWRARALQNLGQGDLSPVLYEKASQSGRNFYALLAMEELGKPVTTSLKTHASTEEIQRVAQNMDIRHAITLFYASQQTGSREIRLAASKQFRYAVRNFSESELLAAAYIAQSQNYYEMAIYAAERTNQLLNYPMRYPLHFQDAIVNASTQYGIDPAWTYGIIRQESRFMTGARSSAGAQGVMQIMPATGRLIAKKLGWEDYDLNDDETSIQMGAAYLSDNQHSLGSEILATAGYNAGPGRARQWRAHVPLEGAIYAETIPFNETRDYVKKVMANATYYESLLGRSGSLKARLGTVPAK